MLQLNGRTNLERIIEELHERKPASALQALKRGNLSPQETGEILRELLLSGVPKGAATVCAYLPSIKLDQKDARYLFLAAAETGTTKVIKSLLEEHTKEIEASTVRKAFICAVRANQIPVIVLLAQTPRITIETKVAAITPSIYDEVTGSTEDGSARVEMGIMETQIKSQSREKRASRVEALVRGPSAKERARNEINEQFDLLVAKTEESFNSFAKMSGALRRTGSEQDTVEMNLALCLREIERQRARALFELNRTKSRDQVIKAGFDQKACRATNRPGFEGKRSAAEIVESMYTQWSNGQQVSWGGFIKALIKEWGGARNPCSPEALSQVIKRNHPKSETISNEEIYKWLKKTEVSPNRQSVGIICRAFKLSLGHEVMIWRICRGSVWHEHHAGLFKQISKPTVQSTPGLRGKLVKTLIGSSGIPDARLQELLKVQQIPMWKVGARIEDLGMCKKFVDLVAPRLLDSRTELDASRELRDALVGVLSDRPKSVLEAVMRAESATHSPGTCFALLTGRYGFKQISAQEMAEALKVSELTIHRMRSSRQQRGGHINEAQAHIIADKVQGVSAAMRGSLTVIERYERALMVDTLTGVREPIALWHQFLSREYTCLGEIIRLTRLRRGDMQLPNTSDFELGKDSVGIRMANKLADYLGFDGSTHRRARREFILHAMGFEVKTTPEDVLNKILDGEVSRLDGLRLMLDLSGRTRGELAKVLGVRKTAVMTWSRSSFDGRISRMDSIGRLAMELELSHLLDDMQAVFGRKRW